MFERGAHQAAGLQAAPLHASASLVPVACPAQPARAYDALYWLACQIDGTGLVPLILDATANEGAHGRHPGRPAGLVHALADPTVVQAGRAVRGMDWQVMPAAQGLRSLQATASAGGARVAVSRLLAPFGPRTAALLYAPATELATLLAGMGETVVVPVLGQAQGSIDAYGALKLLHQSGLKPVLAPLDDPIDVRHSNGLGQVVRSVADCARRHLGLEVEVWPAHRWGELAREGAMTRTLSYDMDSGREFGGVTQAEVRIYWS